MERRRLQVGQSAGREGRREGGRRGPVRDVGTQQTLRNVFSQNGGAVSRAEGDELRDVHRRLGEVRSGQRRVGCGGVGHLIIKAGDKDDLVAEGALCEMWREVPLELKERPSRE
jgi:hypothetical protein